MVVNQIAIGTVLPTPELIAPKIFYASILISIKSNKTPYQRADVEGLLNIDSRCARV